MGKNVSFFYFVSICVKILSCDKLLFCSYDNSLQSYSIRSFLMFRFRVEFLCFLFQIFS